ncbi:AAA family ATPase [Staphylococcus chromogenes]|nr:AAA family ATPase [Staphylococcus chromogenes]
MNRVFSYLDSPGVYSGLSGPPLHTLSHGQSFMHLLENRFHNRGLFLLDEPESGLAPRTQVLAAARMALLADHGAQFIIATHSPILLAIPGADILEISDGVLHHIRYEDTELVQATREFLADPLGTAAYLCSDDLLR